jgi:HD-GYP domain-containing protein (c-di-GMP phosphodiesterase class II)
MQFAINPINLIRSLSLAMELSNGRISQHHWRTAVIANRIAEQIGMAGTERQLLVCATLLHDIGAASRWEERAKLGDFELIGGDKYTHAEAGYELLRDSLQLGHLAEPIRHHHDAWDGSSPSGLAGENIRLVSRIINLADRLEILISDNKYIFDIRADALTALRQLSGRVFDPELVCELHQFAKQESFWLDLTNPHYYHNFFRQIDEFGKIYYSIDDVHHIAEIFATIIDRTSQFTAVHSRTVSEVAANLAHMKGYSSDEVKAMRIAGLLHDLGKLAIPNEILEKPGLLTKREMAVVKQHSYFTYRVLEQIDGFSVIAEWAAFHHETLDGTGYPFRIGDPSLGLGARIVAVADVFSALTENRPYRRSMSKELAEKTMRGMVDNRKLDGSIVNDLFENQEEIYKKCEALG